MKTTAEHEKYVKDLTNLMEDSGKEMSNFVMRKFKDAIKASGTTKQFIAVVKKLKPVLQGVLKIKAMKAANQSYALGKKFASEKVKR
jgi:hypothetical protein